MARSITVGLIPYVIMLAGIPFANSDTQVGPLSLLGLWIGIWVVLTPPSLLLAYRLLPAREREEGRS